MEDSKHWWTSKTIVANALALLASILTGLGIDVGLDSVAQNALTMGFMAGVNIWLRIKTYKAVTLRKKQADANGNP